MIRTRQFACLQIYPKLNSTDEDIINRVQNWQKTSENQPLTYQQFKAGVLDHFLLCLTFSPQIKNILGRILKFKEF
jgi:hypothetical protein